MYFTMLSNFKILNCLNSFEFIWICLNLISIRLYFIIIIIHNLSISQWLFLIRLVIMLLWIILYLFHNSFILIRLVFHFSLSEFQSFYISTLLWVILYLFHNVFFLIYLFHNGYSCSDLLVFYYESYFIYFTMLLSWSELFFPLYT